MSMDDVKPSSGRASRDEEEEQEDDDEDDDVDANADAAVNETTGLARGDVMDEAADGESDGDDDDESKLGSSVLGFAWRCVRSGDYASALAALRSVIEISDYSSLEYRQVVFCCAQLLYASNDFETALRCLMDIHQRMPPPYTRDDACLLIAHIYECQHLPDFAAFWRKKIDRGGVVGLRDLLTLWHQLISKSQASGDRIVTLIASREILARLIEVKSLAPPPPSTIVPLVLGLLATQLEVFDLRRDSQYDQQCEAFAAAEMLQRSGVTWAICERVFDERYLALRRLYEAQFPGMYRMLFGEEDELARRIHRMWRVHAARVERRRLLELRQMKSEDALARRLRRQDRRKRPSPTKSPKTKGRDVPEPNTQHIRLKTKARIQALRVVPSAVDGTHATPVATHAEPTSSSRFIKPQIGAENSPTRRKLQRVRQLRTAVDHELEDVAVRAPAPQRRPSSSRSETSPVHAIDDDDEPEAPLSTSLLDIYAFPAVGESHGAFVQVMGRAPGPADLDLDEIEAFARLAHYRSRVLVERHTPLGALSPERVAPSWLRELDEAVAFVARHHHQQQPRDSRRRRCFTEIHARVGLQLTRLHRRVTLQHGHTPFARHLGQLLQELARWRVEDPETLLRRLDGLRALGCEEEAHRNLEFLHVRQLQQQQQQKVVVAPGGSSTIVNST